MKFDRCASDAEVTRKTSLRPTLRTENGKQAMVLVGEFGIQTTALVDGLRDGFDVGWVHAEPDSAEVVCLQSRRPRPDSLFPHSTVRHRVPTVDLDLSVASFADGGAGPDPARSVVPTILDSEVAFVDQAHPKHSHTSPSYMKGAQPSHAT